MKWVKTPLTMKYGTSSTVCPGSSDPFCIVSYYIKRGTTSWTYSTSKSSSNNTLHKTTKLILNV